MADPNDLIIKARLQTTTPYDKKWDVLRPILEPLFYNTPIKDIARTMEFRYGFRASEEQYKYRYNKVWHLSKNIPQAIKERILRKAIERAAQGRPSRARYKGQIVQAQRIVPAGRLATKPITISSLFEVPLAHLRFFDGYVPFSSNILLAWNRPFGATPSSLTPLWHQPSPYAVGQSPEDVIMETPSDAAGSPAGTMVAQHPATLTATVRKERANLFLTGDFDALTATMSLNEQKLLSTYFYQFWCFSLVTAQQWGVRAHPWTAETQEFARYGGIPDVGTSPQEVSTPGSRLHSLQQVAPSPFCRWAIHLNNPEMFFELQQTEASAAYWQPEVNLTPAFNELLGDALRTGSFTDVDPTSLPLGIPQIVNSSVRTPTELLTEALAFAIMGRNVDLLGNLLRTARKASLDLTGIRPLHLATSYIDGGSTCCLVVDIIMKHVLLTGSLKQFVINEYGHTVLDNLLLSILRSHTRTPIRGVDTALGQHARYAGQEVDICGRWTADSASFRALVASGTANIPLSWKHKFCHSSAQAVSHSAYVVLHHCPESLFSDSGLFQRRCPAPLCGKLLVLGPLHALVVTALHLVTSGYDGEDLFGVLSYYLTLIQAGVDAGAKAEVSVDLIVGSHTYEECSHEELTPTGLAGELQHRMQAWRVPESCVNGWGALLAVMELTENEQRTFNDIEEIQDGYSFRNWCVLNYGEEKRARWLNERPHTGPDKIPENMTEARDALHVSFPNKCDPWACRYYQEDEEEVPPGFRNSPMLGHVWAGVQAELGSYRRLGPEQNWISPQFSMERLWFSLKNSSKPDIGHLQDSDLQDYCRCGRFRHTEARGIGIQSPQDVFE